VNHFRVASIALGLALFLGWVPPAAAIDTSLYVPFAEGVVCKTVSNFACAGSLVLPNNRETVLEYLSATCTNLTPGARLYSLSIGVTTNGVTTAHFIELPLAASIGLAAGSTVAGQVVRLYADPGSQITVSADVLASPVSCTFFVSGQQSPGVT
jgi:hypothetical protein